jgi:hypothetical protein
VYVTGTGSAFIKSGGIIYGDYDTYPPTPGDTENTAISGSGHAVYLFYGKMRSTDTGENLYAKDIAGTWTYIDPAGGGLGDTTTNWNLP